MVCFTAFSCSEGKKKGDGAAVQEMGIKDCNEWVEDLNKMDIMLDGPRANGEKNTPALPTALLEPAQSYKAEELLEKFIIKAERVLELADSRIVVFSERSTFEARIARASIYLGQIYAQRTWQAQEKGAVQTSAVDFAELATRMKRDSVYIKEFISLGMTFGPLEHDLALLKKLNLTQLQDVDQKAEIVMLDYGRQKDLFDRNNNWDNVGYQKLAELSMPMAGYMYNIGSTARKMSEEKLLKKKTRKKK